MKSRKIFTLLFLILVIKGFAPGIGCGQDKDPHRGTVVSHRFISGIYRTGERLL